MAQIESKKSSLSDIQYESLLLAALFHDAIYDPASHMNEEDSATLLLGLSDQSEAVRQVCQIILDTKMHSSKEGLSGIFCEMDMDICGRGLESLLQWEHGIFQECSIFPLKEYKAGRLVFLNSLIDRYPSNSENIRSLIEHVEGY